MIFRKSKDTIFYDTMFFGFSADATSSSSFREVIVDPWSTPRINKVQVWETTQSLESFLMVKQIKGTHFISSIVDIYNFHFPNDQKEDSCFLELKQTDSIERRRIIETLKKYGINSWVCSVENKKLMELFLFHSKENHESIVRYIDLVDYNDIAKIESFNYSSI